MIYLNEFDPFACQWLRNLSDAGELPPAFVDQRDIREVKPDDIRQYTQCHFFGGIGGWLVALRLSGWNPTRNVWTASCPCQPFSVAGKGKGEEDERHLWPVLFDLVRECKPDTIFGEQVSSAAGYRWLDGVFADLEAAGYTCGTADLPAACKGAPHIRQRLFWVADSLHSQRRQERHADGGRPGGPVQTSGVDAETGRLANTRCSGLRLDGQPLAGEASRDQGQRNQRQRVRSDSGHGGTANGMGNSAVKRLEGHWGARQQVGNESSEKSQPLGCASSAGEPGDSGGLGDTASDGWRERGSDSFGDDSSQSCDESGEPFRTNGIAGFWDSFDIIQCLDGKARRVESGVSPLAHGIRRELGSVRSRLEALGFGPKEVRRILRRPRSLLAMAGRNRTGRLRGYGNAIVPQVAAAFIRAFLDVEKETHANP